NKLSCDAKLYSGNSTSTKICDLTKSASNGIITFTGTVPDNIDTKLDGVMLKLTDVFSEYGIRFDEYNIARIYRIQGSADNTFSQYFSEYKADTISPSVSTVDIESKPVTIVDNYKQSHKFWMVSSEILYDESSEARKQNKLSYELFKKDAATGNYSASPSRITYSNGIGSTTKVNTGIATSVLRETPINLKLAAEDEGSYKLKISAFDKANNPCVNQEIPNIYIDNKAPEALIDIQNQPQQVDGTKSVACKFTINDFANSNRNLGAWARVYYCFAKNGETPPVFDEGSAETGTIDSVIGKWAFFEGGTIANTAQLKIDKGGFFDGKLYYFTRDNCLNETAIQNEPISIRNELAGDTISYEESSYAKSAYNITFNTTDPNITTSYYWTNQEGFVQDPKEYVTSDDVGAKSHIGKDGKEHLFNGIYKLHYTTTNKLSGNNKT
ncbi:MAG: hypothetical protein RR263_04550, partial [Oscillospiraceae bacterium]